MYKSRFFCENSSEIALLEEKAKAGDAIACYEIGWRYRYGLGVNQDYSRWISYFENAAQQGHAGACYEPGRLYLQGNVLARIDPELGLAERYVDMGLNSDKHDSASFDKGTYKQSEFITQLEGLMCVITACKEQGIVKSELSVNQATVN